jgi:streptogramin lyase
MGAASHHGRARWNIWFTGGGPDGYIGRITTSGSFTNVAAVVYPGGITTGPDGNLWFTSGGGDTGSIGQITPSGTVTSFANTGIDQPYWITVGPDGNLWFTNYANNTIGRITTSGVVTDFTGHGISNPEIITAGPDGAMWFTNNGTSTIGRITRSGAVTTYSGPGVNVPEIIVPGPDGAMWFANHGSASVGRITTRVTPKITKITPRAGAPGATVTITGINLSSATTVAFNGTAAPINSDSATQIVTQVPAGATAGPITVTTPAGTATSARPFT